LVLEAFDSYWRKKPGIKTLVFKVVPDDATRLAALKGGEVDVAYGLSGALAEEVKRTPGLALKAAKIPVTNWLVFPDQSDPQAPLTRPPLPAGRQSRHQPRGHQHRGLSRSRPRLVELHPPQPGVLLGSALLSVRSEAGARAPRRGGLSERLRGGGTPQRAPRRHRHPRAPGPPPQPRGDPQHASPPPAGPPPPPAPRPNPP